MLALLISALLALILLITAIVNVAHHTFTMASLIGIIAPCSYR